MGRKTIGEKLRVEVVNLRKELAKKEVIIMAFVNEFADFRKMEAEYYADKKEFERTKRHIESCEQNLLVWKYKFQGLEEAFRIVIGKEIDKF